MDLVFNKGCVKIQKVYRGHLIRSLLKRMHRAAFYIQGFVKMRKISAEFQAKRKAVRILQTAFRKWFYMKQITESRMEEILNNMKGQYYKRRSAEHFTLLGNMLYETPKKLGN